MALFLVQNLPINMENISVKEWAEKHGVLERSARNLREQKEKRIKGGIKQCTDVPLARISG